MCKQCLEKYCPVCGKDMDRYDVCDDCKKELELDETEAPR